mmetsp:Transcript_29750/g.83835  ORF Transcript_29750/g.83835 Transcript_29750/m.83835 type:complete len:298 (-) Transcript_29750:948-1841(-)
MDMKLAPDSFATAFATRVFPQPGGPNRSTPQAADRPIASKRCGNFMGSVIAKDSSSRTSFRLPTSSQVTSGVVANPSRRTLGCTFDTAAVKSSIEMARPCSSPEQRGTRLLALSDQAWDTAMASVPAVDSVGPPIASSPSPPGGGMRLVAVSLWKHRFTARAAASFTSAARSAPTKPGVRLLMALKSMSPDSRSFLVWTCKIFSRAASEGMPIDISLSNRPARLRAESKASGRLVAASTTTCLPGTTSVISSLLSTPCSVPAVAPSSPLGPSTGRAASLRSSMQVSIWATIRCSICR